MDHSRIIVVSLEYQSIDIIVSGIIVSGIIESGIIVSLDHSIVRSQYRLERATFTSR